MITHPCPNFKGSETVVASEAWMNNHIPMFYVNLITYPRDYLIAGLYKLFMKEPAYIWFLMPGCSILCILFGKHLGFYAIYL